MPTLMPPAGTRRQRVSDEFVGRCPGTRRYGSSRRESRARRSSRCGPIVRGRARRIWRGRREGCRLGQARPAGPGVHPGAAGAGAGSRFCTAAAFACAERRQCSLPGTVAAQAVVVAPEPAATTVRAAAGQLDEVALRLGSRALGGVDRGSIQRGASALVANRQPHAPASRSARSLRHDVVLYPAGESQDLIAHRAE